MQLNCWRLGCWLWLAVILGQPLEAQVTEPATSAWYRGNLHTHSFWSDGNDFPEMICDWYRREGYHFLALTDHNTLGLGPRWIKENQVAERSRGVALEKYLQRFGSEWVEIRSAASNSNEAKPDREVRLKSLDEYRTLFEVPGEFLLLSGEEISDQVQGRPVHMNATNLLELLTPQGGKTVREAIAANLRAARAQSQALNRPILVHVNHPNFGYAVTAEDLAFVVEERFFEVYNGHPAVGHTGKPSFPGVEEIWDIANTLRIGELRSAPLWGLATDDCHNYHDNRDSIAGRGWVMVRAARLTPETLIEAMEQGDFYASSGVTLKDIQYSAAEGTLLVDVDAEEGVTYRIDFVGTRQSVDRTGIIPVDKDGQPLPATRKYSAEIGQVFQSTVGTSAIYHLKGDELYVRAVITSSRPHPKASFPEQKEQAWTQPAGWEKFLDRDP